MGERVAQVREATAMLLAAQQHHHPVASQAHCVYEHQLDAAGVHDAGEVALVRSAGDIGPLRFPIAAARRPTSAPAAECGVTTRMRRDGAATRQAAIR